MGERIPAARKATAFDHRYHKHTYVSYIQSQATMKVLIYQ